MNRGQRDDTILAALDAATLGVNALPDADLCYAAEFLDPARAQRLFEELRSGVAWEEKTVRLFGRTFTSPRLTAWYGDPGAVYRYSGLELEPRAWIPPITEIRTAVERVMQLPFDSVLLNLYRDGRDSMGWHSDDERELGPEPVIASVSLGATRRFVLRHRVEASRRVTIDLAGGSLLVMRGPTQRAWRHALPKTKRAVEPRINLTFRRVNQPR